MPTNGDRHRIGILLLFVTAVHLPSLFGPFFIDDYVYVAAARSLDFSGIGEVFGSSTLDESASSVWWVPVGTLPFYRPVGELSFALDHAVWSIRPVGYHITNVLLHLLCTFLVWRLAGLLCDTPSPPLAAAAAFALHPVHVEAVGWISGRFDLLVCACVIGSVLCYLRWRRGTPPRTRWAFGSLLLFLIGLGCKETALVLPVMLVGIEILAPGARPARGRLVRLAVGAGFGAITVGYLAWRFALFGGLGRLPPPYGIDRSSIPTALGEIGWNLTQYFLDFVLCIPVDAFYLSDFWRSHLASFAVLTGIALVLAAIAFRLARGNRTFRVGLVWIALFTAPALLAMPGERNVYLAAVGLALIVGAVFASLVKLQGSRPAPSIRARRVIVATVAAWTLISIGQQGVMWGLATAGERVYRDIERLLPDPPPGTRVYIVNQSPLNSVGFQQALRLRYDRDDLIAGVLTVAPTPYPSCKDVIEQTGDDTVRIVREGGFYFESFIDRFHLFGAPIESLSQSAGRFGVELLDPPKSFAGLNTFEFRFPLPIADPRIRIFAWDNTSIRGHFDIWNFARTARLVPWPGEGDKP